MSKLRLFYIYKFTTSRLAEENYKIEDYTIDKARKSGELVSVGDNQVFRHIRTLSNSNITNDRIENLYSERNELKKLPTSPKNSSLITEKQKEIDNLLFIPDIINIKVEHKRHYEYIRKNGFSVNGIKFIRLCSGAGQARQNTATFINQEIFDTIHKKLMNGLKIKKINVAKFNAYYGLYMSGSHFVRTPRVCVIDDCEMKLINKKFDLIKDLQNKDSNGKIQHYRTVNEEYIDPIVNLWDGQGLVDPEFAKEWQEDLKLNFTPCQFVIRAPFIKGMLVTFDFKRFAKEVADTEIIIDYYNQPHNVKDIDVLLSVSQFKMYKHYSSWESYLEHFEGNDQVWGVSKWNKQYDDDISLLNYQYIQSLDLDFNKIIMLSEQTKDWIMNICNGDVLHTLMFLIGSFSDNKTVDELIDGLGNNYLKAAFLNNELLKDKYIKEKIYSSIERRITDAKIGRLWTSGNYQIMVSDPYAQCEFVFKKDIKGLLREGEHWSAYWNKRNVTTVDACRSPMVDFSEHNILSFKSDEKKESWYEHLYSGIVYNVWGIDIYKHSDSDWDGDIVFTTDNEIVIDSVVPNLNAITYDKVSAPVERLNKNNVYKSDKRSFFSKVGQVTNFSTSFISMLADFPKDSMEYKELINRIKLLRRYIGDSIDMAKGIKMKPFPKEWKRKEKIHTDDINEVLVEKHRHNSLVANKKPYFMIYIYSKLNKEYKEYVKHNNIFCREQFGLTFNELLKIKEPTEKQKLFIDNYNKYMPVVNSKCTINELCRNFEEMDFGIKSKIKDGNDNEIKKILNNVDVTIDENILSQVESVYLDYIKTKRNYKNLSVIFNYKNKGLDELYESCQEDSNEYQNSLDDLYKYYKHKTESICNNSKELAYYAAVIIYDKHGGKGLDFLWSVCGDGLIDIIRESVSDVYLPYKDKVGDMYLGKKYGIRRVELIDNIQ